MLGRQPCLCIHKHIFEGSTTAIVAALEWQLLDLQHRKKRCGRLTEGFSFQLCHWFSLQFNAAFIFFTWHFCQEN